MQLDIIECNINTYFSVTEQTNIWLLVSFKNEMFSNMRCHLKIVVFFLHFHLLCSLLKLVLLQYMKNLKYI